MIEIMVGVLIGLVAVLVIYQIFTVAEGLKRNTTGAADAQQNGLLSTLTLALELNNAGSGIAAAGLRLIRCAPLPTIEQSNKPIPALIEPGASDNDPDALVILYSTAFSTTDASEVMRDGDGVDPLIVSSPNGFHGNDRIVLVKHGGVNGTDCMQSLVTKVEDDPGPPDPSGRVKLTLNSPHFPVNSNSVVVNLGPSDPDLSQRVRYAVGAPHCAAANTLCSSDLVVGGASVPLASNVVNMKAQYGVDNDNDGIIDTWVKGDAAPFMPANLLNADFSENNDCNVNPISCIRAFRIGLIVRSDQWDRDLATPAGDFAWTLFDCEDPVKANCPGRMTGTIAQEATGGWRYRVFETVVPLRNQVWMYTP